MKMLKFAPIIASIFSLGACSIAMSYANGDNEERQGANLVTLARILQLPLARGVSGIRTVSEELHRLHGKPAIKVPGGVAIEDGLILADGYRLNLVIEYEDAGVLSISVDEGRCFPLEEAARLTGARPTGAVGYPYAEGPDYDTRSAVKNGVEVALGRFAPAEKCLTEIRLVDVAKAGKFAEENGIDLPVKAPKEVRP
ncbi:hypothetical protein PRJ39_02535 [Lysobacter enzymogenes]|uniref:hypothetical protein n=1 Tax=Lysobacter enzymogenes TaxID=69 RepID=UPI003747D57A